LQQEEEGMYHHLLSISAKRSLLYVTFSAALFLYLHQVFSDVRVSHTYLHQFIWHVHFTEVISGWLVTAQFVQWNSKAIIHQSKKGILQVGVPLLHAHTAHAVCTMKKCYFSW
jgi:hypothetical protein